MDPGDISLRDACTRGAENLSPINGSVAVMTTYLNESIRLPAFVYTLPRYFALFALLSLPVFSCEAYLHCVRPLVLRNITNRRPSVPKSTNRRGLPSPQPE